MPKTTKTQPLPKPEHWDEQTEQALLGSILVSGDFSLEVMDDLSEILTHEMFYSQTHQQIYFVMTLLWKAEKKIGTIEILDAVKEFEIDFVDQKTILTIASKSSLLSSTKTAAKIIKRMHSERNILALTENIKNCAQIESHMESRLLEIQVELDNYNLKKDGVEIKTSEKMFSGFLAKQLQRKDNQDFKPSISSGIAQLDIENVLFKAGNLVTIAGRPGSGKTALAAILIDNFCQKNLNSLFFSLEMTEEQMTERMYAFKANVNPIVVQNFGLPGSEGATKMHKEKLEFAEQYWQKTPYQAIFSFKMDIWKLIKDVKIAHKKKPLDILIIDQLSEITTGNMFSGQRNETIETRTFVVSSLKKLALELKIPIIMLHQLNRDADKRENRIPQNSDLKDSGSVEEKSDMILLLFNDDKKDDYKIIISKNRNGKPATVSLKWDTKLAKIQF